MKNRFKLATVLVFLLFACTLVFDFDKVGAQDEMEQVLPRPGLQIEILEAQIPEDLKVEAVVKITDDRGLPLDMAGIETEGTVSLSFILARIPVGESQYIAYTVRNATGPVMGTVQQASIDSRGTFTSLGNGGYRYKFGTSLPNYFDRSATHTIAVQGVRDLRGFDGNRYVGINTFSFVPSGGELTVREVVSDNACNSCHNPLKAHGGGRQKISLCIMCHQPQTSDPDTGNTVDFKVMIHKIHMGSKLPSVVTGTPYRIIGNNNSVHDYSSVEFPQDIRNCTACHSGGNQQNNYLTKLSRVACGSCHDNVDFAAGINHFPQSNDSMCGFCHKPTSSTEFDISVAGAHVVPLQSRQLQGVNFQIISVANSGPGQKPSVVFNIKDNNGNSVVPGNMNSLSLVLSGPTDDYAMRISENARNATVLEDSNFEYTFTKILPQTATGSYSVGIEGYRNVEISSPDGPISVREAGKNFVYHFAVTGGLANRREVVKIENCNSCHKSLSLHGGNRNDVRQCVLCHNPNLTDIARRPQDQTPDQSVDFKLMIHRVHSGEKLANDYTVYGFGGSAHNYNEKRIPADLRDCTICHTGGSQFIPSVEGRLSTINPRGLVSPTPPISTACSGCHDSNEAQIHMSLNSNSFGESCIVCHGEGLDYSVSNVHFYRRDTR